MNHQKKKTDFTVFFRYTPTQDNSNITRKDFESFFSNVGPIKKCSLIRSTKAEVNANANKDNANDNNNNQSNDNTDAIDDSNDGMIDFSINNGNGNNGVTVNTKPKLLRETKGYGFCKFTCKEDAEEAVQTCNESYMELEYGQRIKVHVDLASNSSGGGGSGDGSNNNKNGKAKRNKGNNVKDDSTPSATPSSTTTTSTTSTTTPTSTPSQEILQLQAKKRTSRVILRNLSFYATEHHIKTCMEEHFGSVAEITLPLVPMVQQDEDERNGRNGRNKFQKKKKQQQHRGFAFVTFVNPSSAQKAVDCDEEIKIKKRPVAIDFSIPKNMHQRLAAEEKGKEQQQQEDDEEEVVEEEEDVKMDDEEESSSDSDSENSNDDDESDSDSDSEASDNDSMQVDKNKNEESESDQESNNSNDESESESEEEEEPQVENNVSSSLFIRNLPFDATRHELFTLFSQFGYIEGIYLVKDKDTGINRGTAFINFRKEGGCIRALEAAATSNSSSIITSTVPDSGELILRGRTIFLNRAVDKSTASSLKVERDEDGKPIRTNTGKDRRNLYLKNEGRVLSQQELIAAKIVKENDKDGGEMHKDAWEQLPSSDQQKRGRAHQDKASKLRSPLFFFNPFRLSVRNLSKDVDEVEFKALIVKGIQNGLQRNLVSKQDVVAHLRASGEMTNREIVQKVKEDGEDLIPAFNETSVKQFVPSVFIDRDFQSVGSGKKVVPPSKGFGFVDFTHHAHALACLRELNNNMSYSAEYCAGGKRAITMKKQQGVKNLRKKKKKKKMAAEGGGEDELMEEDGTVKIPRLIVEFTVENKSKAQKQAERREMQRDNAEKQKIAKKEMMMEEGDGNTNDSKADETKKKKKGRGAIQREKKRKRKQDPTLADKEKSEVDRDDNHLEQDKTNETKEISNTQGEAEVEDQSQKKKKKKGVKPPKKMKLDKEEVAFEDMVKSYKQAITAGTVKGEDTKSTKKSVAREVASSKRWFH